MGVSTQLHSHSPSSSRNSEYKLKSLLEVEQEISQSKHLPGMPSIDNINGWKQLSIGDRDMKLLEKVEELTLYIIDLHKRIEKLEKI